VLLSRSKQVTEHSDYEWPKIDWKALNAHRDRNLQSVVKSLGLDGLILSCSDNIRYFTRVRTIACPELLNDQYGAIVTPDGSAYVWGFWLEHDPLNPSLKSAIGIPSWAPSIRLQDMWVKLYAEKLRELKAKRVGVEHLPFQIYTKLQDELRNVEFVSAFNELQTARSVKHAEEVKLLENSAHIGDAGEIAGAKAAKAGRTEHAVIGEVAKAMLSSGAEFVSHSVIASGGSLNTLGCVGDYTTYRTLKEGDNVVLDIGVYGKGGYATDVTRTVFVGRPNDKLKEGYDAIIESYEAGMRKAVPGNKAGDIDIACCKVLRDSGYVEPPYGVGHGIGLRVMEAPLIKGGSTLATDNTVLKPGMVLCVEPETVVNGKSVKIEEVVLVTDHGPRQLSGAHNPLRD
jgi:Xaa-Pro dipeptidase